MQKETTYLTKEVLYSLVNRYVPQFNKYGVAIQLRAQSYDKRILLPIEDDQKIKWRRFKQDVKSIVTQDIDLDEEEALFNMEFYRVPCIIVSSSPLGSSLDAQKHRQYSFPLRKQDHLRVLRVPPHKVLLRIERLLKKNLSKLCRGAEITRFCRNSFFDYFRYAYGYYGYLEKINGINRTDVQFLLASPLLIIAIAIIIFLFP